MAEAFADPLRHGVTRSDGVLGGALPGYNLYRAADGWVAVAALEPHFRRRLEQELGVADASCEDLARIFRARPATEWERRAAERDLPIAVVCEA